MLHFNFPPLFLHQFRTLIHHSIFPLKRGVVPPATPTASHTTSEKHPLTPFLFSAGTDVYIPREYYTTGSYTTEGGTVWAIGCLAYVLHYRRPPFLNRDQVVEGYGSVSHHTPHKQPPISPGLEKLIEGCLESDPEKRWSLDDIRQFQWG